MDEIGIVLLAALSIVLAIIILLYLGILGKREKEIGTFHADGQADKTLFISTKWGVDRVLSETVRFNPMGDEVALSLEGQGILIDNLIRNKTLIQLNPANFDVAGYDKVLLHVPEGHELQSMLAIPTSNNWVAMRMAAENLMLKSYVKKILESYHDVERMYDVRAAEKQNAYKILIKDQKRVTPQTRAIEEESE